MKYSRKSELKAMGFIFAGMALLSFTTVLRSADKIDVRTFVQGKKVIPAYCKIGNWEITDIKLPDLIVTNRQKAPVTVDRVDVIGKVAGVETVRMQISGEDLWAGIRKAALWINNPTTQLPAIQLSYGNVALPAGPLSETGTAAQGQSILLPLAEISYLHHVSQAKLDGMDIEVTLRSGLKKTVTSFPVALCIYQQKGTYQFPMKGDLRMAFLPLSYIHHRGSASQEFAMDLVGANQAGAASFTDISIPDPKTLTDYSIWGRDVFAMGDGVVVETGTRFPEDRMSNPALFRQPGYAMNLIKELIPQIGWTNAVAGNYVVIDHQNGEFSIYCHLQEGSLRVVAGDRVAKGAVIAGCGNTGNSGAPHLHFQLIDSRDFFTANGLPMMFENIPGEVVIAEYPVSANTLGFSDSVYATVQ